MTLYRRHLDIFFITFIFLITNFVVHHNNLNKKDQSEIFETHIKSAVAIFIPATHINPFLYQHSKSKENDKNIHVYSFSTEIFSYQINLYSVEIGYLKNFFELKYSQKSPRAPPVA